MIVPSIAIPSAGAGDPGIGGVWRGKNAQPRSTGITCGWLRDEDPAGVSGRMRY